METPKPPLLRTLKVINIRYTRKSFKWIKQGACRSLRPLILLNLMYFCLFTAIHLCEESVADSNLAICLKNRAAVYLKEEDYDAVVADCTRYVLTL